jgi:5-methylcytosine-specific restriction endonuclease McrA
MSASYKPALLRSVVVCVQRGKVAECKISLLDLAEQFLCMYWAQSVVFRFRHSPRASAPPEIVQQIRRTSQQTGVRDLGLLPEVHRSSLRRRIARVLTINVLETFHVSKPASMPVLYVWERGEQAIRLSPEASAFVRAEAHALTVIANYYWARFLTRLNASPRIIDKLERDRPLRSQLKAVGVLMRKRGESNCFYCGISLGAENPLQVDHFIPWAFVFEDKEWNLVASCPACNAAKSDSLPDESFLQKLIRLNRERRSDASKGWSALSRGGNPEEQLKDLFELARSEQWPSGWFPGAISARGRAD